MAWQSGAPTDWLENYTVSNYGDDYTARRAQAQYAPYMREVENPIWGDAGGGKSWEWDPDAYTAAQQALLPADTLGTLGRSPASQQADADPSATGGASFSSLSRDQFNDYGVWNHLGYGDTQKDALWNYIKATPGDAYGANIIRSGDYSGHFGSPDPNNAWANDPTAYYSTYTPGLGNFLNKANTFNSLGLNQQQLDATNQLLEVGGHFNREQNEDTTFSRVMRPIGMALMAIGSGGVLGGGMGAAMAAANTGMQAARGEELGGNTLMGGMAAGMGSAMAPALSQGISSQLSGAGLSDTLANIGGKAGSAGIMTGTRGGGLEDMATSALMGGAGAGINAGINSLSGDSPWGVNPQTTGSLGDTMGEGYDDFWGDQASWDNYDWGTGDQGGMDMYNAGGDIYGNTGLDNMSAMDTSMAPDASFMPQAGMDFGDSGSGGINWGSLATSALPVIMKLLGGGSTAPTGGTMGGTGGGTMGTMGGIGDLFSNIYDYNSASQSSDMFRQIMGQAAGSADPYAARRPGMGAQFDQLMTDPMSSNLVRSLDQSFQNEYDARGAQAGTYNTNYGTTERESQRMANIVKALPQLAQPFGQASGAYSNPAQAGAITAEMAKGLVPLELAKANAVGRSVNSGMTMTQQALPEIMRWLQSMGGGAQGM